MNHKIDPNSNPQSNPSNDGNDKIASQPSDQNQFGHKLPQNSFRDFLKSKVHRPHVSQEFIQQIKKTIPRD